MKFGRPGIRFCIGSLERLLFRAVLERLSHLEERIMATQQELAADLKALGAQVTKIGAETQSLHHKVDSLQAALDAAGSTTPEVDAAMADLRASVQAVDDLVADAPAPAPEEPEEPEEPANP